MQGYRVTDFGWVWAGATLGQVLADMGAEVIKVESRRRLDGLRLGRVFELGDAVELNPHFHNLNRSKLSVTINMELGQGVSLIKDLVRISDVVVDNFRAGVMQKHGLGYKALVKVRRDIIAISLSAAGQTGPLSDILAYATIISGLSGIDSLMGYIDDCPLGVKHAYIDLVASLFGAFAVLAALRHRNLTGEGQYIDLSQWEVADNLIGEAIMDYFMNQRVMKTQGNRHAEMAPHGHYPCLGADQWISIAVKTEQEWQALCQAMGDPPWTREEKFSDRFNRLCNQDKLDEHLSEWTKGYTPEELTRLLQQAGVAAFPCYNSEGLFFDPHFKERGIYEEVEHPKTGNEFVYATPIRLEKTPGRISRHAPLLGQDNDYVLRELLGLTPKRIEALSRDKVIY
jgi:crotonobetainyl-CoA:carnitine CoA-transferase CaiB-like acyl-CoA transferase